MPSKALAISGGVLALIGFFLPWAFNRNGNMISGGELFNERADYGFTVSLALFLLLGCLVLSIALIAAAKEDRLWMYRAAPVAALFAVMIQLVLWMQALVDIGESWWDITFGLGVFIAGVGHAMLIFGVVACWVELTIAEEAQARMDVLDDKLRQIEKDLKKIR
jgi:hypothetical protein